MRLLHGNEYRNTPQKSGHFLYESGEFLDVDSYTNVQRWTKAIQERPAVRRGQRVNRVWGDEAKRLPERHSAADLDD
jgi:GST-like protein